MNGDIRYTSQIFTVPNLDSNSVIYEELMKYIHIEKRTPFVLSKASKHYYGPTEVNSRKKISNKEMINDILTEQLRVQTKRKRR